VVYAWLLVLKICCLVLSSDSPNSTHGLRLVVPTHVLSLYVSDLAMLGLLSSAATKFPRPPAHCSLYVEEWQLEGDLATIQDLILVPCMVQHHCHMKKYLNENLSRLIFAHRTYFLLQKNFDPALPTLQ
jgi:hypothetical protein